MTHFSIRQTLYGLLTVSLVSACSGGPSDQNVGQSAPATLKIGEGEYTASGVDDSDMFQRTINTVSENGGGEIKVAAGQYRIRGVDLKSNVHILFEKDVILMPATGKGANLFNCGNDGETVRNVSIIGPKDRFLADFTIKSVQPEITKLRLIGVGDCDGFRFANFNIRDNYTVFSSLIFGWRGHDGPRAQHGRNGIVENITAENAHYGYGAIQAHSGENIKFRNIKSIGGVAVRLETGLKPMNRAQIGGLDKIEVDGAYSLNGQAALMFQPHTMNHGVVTARNIEADGSEFAVSIAKPFVSKSRYTAADNLAPGNYRSLSIDTVKATYRDGPIITRFVHLKYYPVELHSMIKRVGGMISQPDLRGPSIAAVSMQDTLSENISITNVEAIGFKYHPDIITKKDIYNGNLRAIAGRKKSGKKKSR